MSDRQYTVSIVGATGVKLAANTPSAAVAIPAGARVVTIVNTTEVLAYVRAGDSAVVADVNAMPILPGSVSIFEVSGATHIAGFAAAEGILDIVPGG